MDPTDWFYKTYFDCGKYCFGLFASSLQPLSDCPSNAAFVDASYQSSHGSPVHIPNAFCIFEKYAGGVMWRHAEIAIPNQVDFLERNPVLEVLPVATKPYQVA